MAPITGSLPQDEDERDMWSSGAPYRAEFGAVLGSFCSLFVVVVDHPLCLHVPLTLPSLSPTLTLRLVLRRQPQR